MKFILVGISGLEQQPESAFAAARRAVQAIGAYLQSWGMQDFGSSHVTLLQELRYRGGEQRFVGYAAKIGFNAVLRNTDQVEETVTGTLHRREHDEPGRIPWYLWSGVLLRCFYIGRSGT